MLLRSIDLITLNRPKALLWQAGVTGGGNSSDRSGGALIVSGLNLLSASLAAPWLAASRLGAEGQRRS